MLGIRGYRINGVIYKHSESLVKELDFCVLGDDYIIDIGSGKNITHLNIIRENKLKLLLDN